MYKNCQVCGNPIFSPHDYGTDTNGRLNADYCSNCYKNGHFYYRDVAENPENMEDSADPTSCAWLFAGRVGPGLMGGAGLFGNGFMGL